jgi:radical SAM protein with 4Fe4S-binding SPASM domain
MMENSSAKKLKPALRPGVIFSETDDQCNVLDLIDLRHLKMNSVASQILALCNGKNSLEKIIEDIIKHSSLSKDEMERSIRNFISILLEKDIILSESPKNIASDETLKPKPPGVVFFEMTKACNLKCIWCYNNSHDPLAKELTTEQWKQCIDQLSGHECTLLFTGGEPLSRSDLFEIAGYAKSAGLNTQLFTNGTLIDPGKAQAIADTFDYVRITIDGATAATNDAVRGKGGFDRALNGLKLLVDRGVRVCWQTIVSQINIHELNLIPQQAIEVGASGLRMASVDPIGRGGRVKNLQLNHAQEFVFWSFMAWAAEEYKEKIQIDWGADYCLEDTWQSVMSIEPGKATSSTPEGRKNPEYYMRFARTSQCGVGSRSFLINPQGFIGLCPLLVPPDITLGNVFEHDILDVWYNHRVFSIFRDMTLEDYDDCSRCGVRYRCLGGCRGRAFHFQRSLKGCDEKMLKYLKVPK